MSDTRHPAPTQPARSEILRDDDFARRPLRRPTPSLIAAIIGAVRSVVEDAYVSLAQEVMAQTEWLGDARAEKRHKKSVRTSKRQRLKAQQMQAGVPRHHADARRSTIRTELVP